MPKTYRVKRGASRLLYKIRHHRGHGIHSPFVFDLVTKVIEEKSTYYAYQDIKDHLENFPNFGDNTNKTHRLLFKLVNWFSAKQILELGTGSGLSSLYLTAPSSDCTCVSVALSDKILEDAEQIFKNWDRKIALSKEEFPLLIEKQDCIYINLKNYEVDSSHLINYLVSSVKEESFIIIDGIRTKKKHQLLWKEIILKDEVVISLDLYHLGILFFNKKYYKQNYKLSF